MIFRIALQILAVGIALLANQLDYKWHDKRSKKFISGRRALFALSVIFMVGSIILVVTDENNKNQQISQLNSSLKSLNDSLSSLKSFGIKSSTSQNFKTDSLLALSNNLKDNLAPFLSIAKARYPTLKNEQALSQLHNDFLSLEKKTGELEVKIKPRVISPEQEQKLVSILKIKHYGVFIACKAFDVESFDFGKSIEQAFNKAGWQTFVNQSALVDFKGISIYERNDNPSDDVKKSISRFLADAGFKVVEYKLRENQVTAWPTATGNQFLVIVVGEK